MQPVTDPILACRECSAGYGARTVFADVDLEVRPGETLAIVGPSGCGKSTLLLTLAGLHRASSGLVLLRGIPLVRPDAGIGLVLQQYGLFPWLTVLRNATLGLEVRSRRQGPRSARSHDDAARDMLGRLGLGGRANDYPRRLSGGEQQRLALCRTLLLDPEVLLLDEPFSALDALTREELQDLLLEVLSDGTIAAVLVTHSIDEAVYLGDRLGILAAGGDAADGDAADDATTAGGTPLAPPARLTPEPNPGGCRGLDRADPAYHRACSWMRRRFREVVRA